jgi:hypothetical protein
MVCLDARHAKKALDMKANKTDANDAEGWRTWCAPVPGSAGQRSYNEFTLSRIVSDGSSRHYPIRLE